MELGYQLSSEEHPASDLVGYARRAEEAGFSYAVISDHFHPWLHRQGQSPFVWSVLGAIAQVTKRLRIGTAVTAPIRRTPPYLVAHAAATVTTMMPGRFFLGVGSGENLNEHVTGEWWPPSETRREMLEEAVDVIRKLWAGGTVEHFGKHYTVDNARIYSRPLEPPPIMVSAGGSDGAELAARIGDGLIGTAPSGEVVEAFVEAGGKGKPRYAQIDVCVAADEAEARRIAHAQWAAPAAVPPRLLTKLRVAADFQAVADLVTEEQVAQSVLCSADHELHLAKIKEFLDAGFDHVHVHQVGADQATFFRFYERDVLPRVAEL
ncbi:MAG: TIGR03557 family F420-dependent LLM class oxidoreductase [Actinobacteria bacterium]|nr:TIGR03557 family F420-dependent LLM class oxidoreductase [Actinomycetota bacterium]